ncbi:MAG: hypothetical protein KC912_26335 [Proteobacteria bacterium]|nr:hypothetical protein [Pseudomonadota bacterium]
MLNALCMLALLTSPAAAGKRNKQAKAPEVPPLPAALTLPADRAPVYANSEEAPALLGTNLDLTSLSRTQITWTIGVDLAFLDTIDHDLALTQLAVDPRWRVGREEGGVVAVARQAVDGKSPTWSMPWHGYAVDSKRCTRTGFTFSERTREWAWDNSDFVATTKSTDESHTLTGVRLLGSACRGQMGTALVVEGPITLEIFEGGTEDGRPHTMSVVDDIQKLRELPFSGPVIERQGYTPRLVPEGGIRSGHPSLDIARSDSGLMLEAWQNPGAAGWTWLRILDGDLQPWEEDAVATATLERVGWSESPEERFLMQAEIPLPSGRAFSGTVEIWTVPDGSEDPVRVDSTPIKIPTR